VINIATAQLQSLVRQVIPVLIDDYQHSSNIEKRDAIEDEKNLWKTL